MTVRRVIFTRPGETDWNRSARWQGWVATPMNAHGEQQVRRLANFIRNIGVKALYTSDLWRALQTAAILSDKLGFPAVPDARLRERDIGRWQGLTPKEMQAWYPDEYGAFLANPEAYRVPSGESRHDVRLRMVDAFNDYLKADVGDTIAIISHSTAINALLSEIIPGVTFGTVDMSNTSVTTIQRSDGGTWALTAADDISHLEGLEAGRLPELEE